MAGDTVHWRSLGDAHHAAELFMGLSSAHTLMALIDETSISMHHFESAQSYT
jgi:hypothetical protein